jgi:hypothetical protein
VLLGAVARRSDLTVDPVDDDQSGIDGRGEQAAQMAPKNKGEIMRSRLII